MENAVFPVVAVIRATCLCVALLNSMFMKPRRVNRLAVQGLFVFKSEAMLWNWEHHSFFILLEPNTLSHLMSLCDCQLIKMYLRAPEHVLAVWRFTTNCAEWMAALVIVVTSVITTCHKDSIDDCERDLIFNNIKSSYVFLFGSFWMKYCILFLVYYLLIAVTCLNLLRWLYSKQLKNQFHNQFLTHNTFKVSFQPQNSVAINVSLPHL